MIPILTADQVREADQFTIEETPIASIDLMERASVSFTNRFGHFFDDSNPVVVIAGVGNNGGDALAIARLLRAKHYKVTVYVIGDLDKGSSDFQTNLSRLNESVNEITTPEEFPGIKVRDVIIDGMFGSGLSRPVAGLHGDLITHLNDSQGKIVSVDIASGLYADRPVGSDGRIIEPVITLSFQLPKLAFFQPELAKFVGDWHVIPIGLKKDFISTQKTNYYLTEEDDIRSLLPARPRFSHKGVFGRVQLICGGKGKMGAAIMAGSAAMRAGTGLLFMQVPGWGAPIVQQRVIEAMVVEDPGIEEIAAIDIQKDLDSIGLGPGLGTSDQTVKAFTKFLDDLEPHTARLVMDADALNILASHKELMSKLPDQTILTPHPGEFQRLVGPWKDDFDKLDRLRDLCTTYSLNVVVKGAQSACCNSQGIVHFNCTGNPGMATAGSGDVLLGIIASLAGQGMTAEDAQRLGVYVHGLSGDLAAKRFGERSLIASDLITHLPDAFRALTN